MDRLPELSSIDITPLVKKGTKIVTSYSEYSVSVNKEKFERSIFITPNSVEYFLDAQNFLNDIKDDFNTIIIYGSDDNDRKNNFKNLFKLSPLNKVVSEFMNLAPACRTYNILATEGRDVIAIFDF